MKFRKQSPAKALIVAVTAGLLAAFLALIRADPGIEAESTPVAPTPNFDRFFVPETPAQATPAPAPTVQPHTRTRAS